MAKTTPLSQICCRQYFVSVCICRNSLYAAAYVPGFRTQQPLCPLPVGEESAEWLRKDPCTGVKIPLQKTLPVLGVRSMCETLSQHCLLRGEHSWRAALTNSILDPTSVIVSVRCCCAVAMIRRATIFNPSKHFELVSCFTFVYFPTLGNAIIAPCQSDGTEH
jgi:hypothetical protein